MPHNGLITQHLNARNPPKSSYLNQNRHLIWIKSFTGTLSTQIPCIKWNTGVYQLNLHVNGLYQYFRSTFSTAWFHPRHNIQAGEKIVHSITLATWEEENRGISYNFAKRTRKSFRVLFASRPFVFKLFYCNQKSTNIIEVLWHKPFQVRLCPLRTF